VIAELKNMVERIVVGGAFLQDYQFYLMPEL
jgi:hypothetical protein